MKKPEPFTEEQLVLIKELMYNVYASSQNAAAEAKAERVAYEIEFIEYEIKEQLKSWDEEHGDK